MVAVQVIYFCAMGKIQVAAAIVRASSCVVIFPVVLYDAAFYHENDVFADVR
jgi:hypothetical protein